MLLLLTIGLLGWGGVGVKGQGNVKGSASYRFTESRFVGSHLDGSLSLSPFFFSSLLFVSSPGSFITESPKILYFFFCLLCVSYLTFPFFFLSFFLLLTFSNSCQCEY